MSRKSRVERIREAALGVIKETPNLYTNQIISRIKDDIPKSYNLSSRSVSRILKGTPNVKNNYNKSKQLVRWIYEE